MYLYVAGQSPHGGGAAALLERLVPGWRGKLLILVLLGLIFVFGTAPAVIRYGVVTGSIALTLFMMFLELLVAFLQAYIFALLTSVFIGLMQHEH